MTLFDHSSYKAFIAFQIHAHSEVKGYRSKLAAGAKCQRTYLSQVLNGPIHLTPEHAASLAEFWNLGPDEAEYFVQLVHLDRAGTPGLRRVTQKRLREIQQKRLNLSERFLAPPTDLTETPYYGSWLWSAVHILATIPKYQTLAAISDRMAIPTTEVEKILKGLQAMELVEYRDGRWTVTQLNIHLPKNSPWNSVHQNNWRQRAVVDAQMASVENLHYTAVVSASDADFQAIRELLLEFIDRKRTIVASAKEEDLYCVCLDLFRV